MGYRDQDILTSKKVTIFINNKVSKKIKAKLYKKAERERLTLVLKKLRENN